MYAIRSYYVEIAGLKMAGEVLEQRHDVAPDQGLAAGQAQLAHPAPHEGAAYPVKLLQRQDVRLRSYNFV